MPVAENPHIYARHFGAPVSFTGSPAGLRGVFDVADVDVLDENGRAVITVGDPVVQLPTSIASTRAQGSAITVDGTNYTVRSKHRMGDGAFTAVALRKV